MLSTNDNWDDTVSAYLNEEVEASIQRAVEMQGREDELRIPTPGSGMPVETVTPPVPQATPSPVSTPVPDPVPTP